MEDLTRRRLLQTTSSLPVVTFAGCSALPDRAPSTTQTPEYEHLEQTPIHVSDDVGVRIPEGVPTVEAPTNADLVVLHGSPAVDAERAVTWLADERAVALLGDSAQRTWLEWTRSETYRDTFGASARSESEPTPHLLVAGAVEINATTYRYSWADLPSNAEILRALDDAMADIETRTS